MNIYLATPPGTLQTSLDTKNDHRLTYLQCSESFSRSKSSPIESPSQEVESHGGATLIEWLRRLSGIGSNGNVLVSVFRLFSRGAYNQPYTRTSLRGPIISQAYYGIPPVGFL